jgi:hypothetical protein
VKGEERLVPITGIGKHDHSPNTATPSFFPSKHVHLGGFILKMEEKHAPAAGDHEAPVSA